MRTRLSAALAAAALACVLAVPARAQESQGTSQAKETYLARLHPLNTKVSKSRTTGEARFQVVGDSLTISVDVKGAPPGVIHWQHFHGFKMAARRAAPPRRMTRTTTASSI